MPVFPLFDYESLRYSAKQLNNLTTATGRYFAILDISGVRVGIVIISPNRDNGYDYKFYTPDLMKCLPAKISWLIAIQEAYPALVEDL